MRICIDMDGVICHTRTESQNYEDVMPLPGAVETMKKWRAQGWYIIIDTSRHMYTSANNVGVVIARQGKTLLEWLDKHEIPYDEVHFGKPLADIYIDDKGHKFTSWKDMNLCEI